MEKRGRFGPPPCLPKRHVRPRLPKRHVCPRLPKRHVHPRLSKRHVRPLHRWHRPMHLLGEGVPNRRHLSQPLFPPLSPPPLSTPPFDPLSPSPLPPPPLSSLPPPPPQPPLPARFLAKRWPPMQTPPSSATRGRRTPLSGGRGRGPQPVERLAPLCWRVGSWIPTPVSFFDSRGCTGSAIQNSLADALRGPSTPSATLPPPHI